MSALLSRVSQQHPLKLGLKLSVQISVTFQNKIVSQQHPLKLGLKL